jgi:uncharacterized protein YdeI (YjbR/CyaY-like superfamily)
LAGSPKVHDASQKVDEYIESAEEFARPICRKLREIILKAEPGIIEDWKWGPNYQKSGMICGFHSFKKHVNLSFFKGSLLSNPEGILKAGENNLNIRSVKFKSEKEVNGKILTSYIREAIRINESGSKPDKKELAVPEDFNKLLNKNAKAKKIFQALAYTHKKEYIVWIEGAKKAETRERRLKRAIEMLKKNEKGV